MRKEKICEFSLVLGLMSNRGQSYIGSATPLPDTLEAIIVYCGS